MAGKGGGAWKVAYADFVTAMMAFFMVMWLVGQNKKVRDAVAAEFRAPTAWRLPPRRPSASKKNNAPALMEKKQKKPPIPIDDPMHNRQRGSSHRNLTAAYAATLIFFAEDAAELDQEAKAKLERFVPWVAGKAYKIEIRGHASRRPPPPGSPFADSWQLCYARCLATANFLEAQGIARDRMRLSQAAGFEPYSTRVDEQWQARNSRVEIAMLNEVAEQTQRVGASPQGDGSTPEAAEGSAAPPNGGPDH